MTTNSDHTSGSSALPTSTYLITLPLPSVHPSIQLVAHLTHFRDRSLMLWCGEANPTAATTVATARMAEGENVSVAEISDAAPIATSSLLVEEHHPASHSQPQPPTEPAPPPTGVLGREWAVAMSAPNNSPALSTSLFRTNLDMAKPMAARLSKRYQVSQLFLSLSLPEQLLDLLEGPVTDPLGSKALLLLESSLGRVIKQSLEA